MVCLFIYATDMKISIRVYRKMKNSIFCRPHEFMLLCFTLFIGFMTWTFYSKTSIPLLTEIRIFDGDRCPLEWKSPLHKNPLLKLDPHKFIFPLLINGPNNQMIGLRDSIFLSIALNRTLILPQFYQHKSSLAVETELRVDVKTLSTLISVKRPSEINKLCEKDIRALFITDRSLWMLKQDPPFHRLADLSGVEKLHRGTVNTVQLLPSEDFKGLQRHEGTVPLMRKLYTSNERCALYVYPFRSVGTRECASAVREARKFMSEPGQIIDVNTIDPELLYSIGYINSPKPKFVKQIADDFRSGVFRNQSLIAVHWRFDREDWMLRCAKQDKPDGKQIVIDICDKIEKIQAVDIATGIEGFRKLLKEKYKIDASNVYFAAPLTMQKLVDKVTQYFANTNTKLFTYSDAKRHMEQYSECYFVSEYFDDILSSFEMDLCLHSAAFLSSDTSSWSSNIIRDRNANKWNNADKPILNIVWEAHQQRVGQGGG